MSDAAPLPHITLTREDAEALASEKWIEVRDPDGNVLGEISSLTLVDHTADEREDADGPAPVDPPPPDR